MTRRRAGYVRRVTAPARPLRPAEAAILGFLLSADFPGAGALRHQARAARVVEGCPCGCASVELEVDPAAPRALQVSQYNAVEARGVHVAADLILFVADGRLASMEIVGHGAQRFTEFPAPDAFAPAEANLPRRRWAAAA